ncbi:hypothetical protein [uncultured Gemmiger sp.]|uniref:hypothetical protein n=1 Tax=uncultured Gemmiger sp. TaxID=1623490 RepID=UPI0025E7E405|nr:hypothetical protein [uncultured Gemmiger sp.]
MKTKRKSFYKFLLFWLVILPIYQDSPLSKILGAAGYSVLMPVALILITLYILIKGKIPREERLNELVNLGIYICGISAVAVAVWAVAGNSLTVVGEFLPIKAVKVCLQYFSYPSYIGLVLICARKVGTECIERYAYYTLLVLTILCIIERQQIPYAFQKLHSAGTFPYWRVRLLTLESSWTAMMIYVYSFIALYYGLRKKKEAIVGSSVLCAAILILFSGAKSLMAIVGITLVLFVLFLSKHMNKKIYTRLLICLFIGIIFAIMMLPNLISAVQSDIHNYTSVATRGYTALIGIAIGIMIPTGVGGAVYLGVFPEVMRKYLYLFDRLPLKLDTSEIVSLVTAETDEALTVKSGLLHYNMYWGILGSAYLTRNFMKVSKALKKNHVYNNELLRAVFWGAVILVTFACNFSFEFWLLYIYLICLSDSYIRKSL